MRWAASHAFPPKVRALILTRDPICRCTACKWHTTPCTKPAREADHIIEVTDGGTDHPDNGQGLCKACHAQKTSRHAHHTRYGAVKRPAERHPGLR